MRGTTKKGRHGKQKKIRNFLKEEMGKQINAWS